MRKRPTIHTPSFRLGAFAQSAVFCALFALSTAPVHAAPKDKEKDLGGFGAWHAYAYDEGGQSVCYMLTTKTVPVADGTKNRTAYLMITHRPTEASTDVFSYGAGVSLNSKRKVAIKIGSELFDLFSARDTAWARDALTDHKIATAMRSSQAAATTSSYAAQGGPINDQFSLNGAHPAYRAINKACGLQDIEPQKAETKKPEAKKTDVKKADSKKIEAKKPEAKKAEPPKAEAKKSAFKKSATPKSATKKSVAQKPAAQKTETLDDLVKKANGKARA